jgi:hypothetical protein
MLFIFARSAKFATPSPVRSDAQVVTSVEEVTPCVEISSLLVR